MKKKICLALTVCLALTMFAGCSKKTDSSKKDTSKNSKVETGLSYKALDYVTLGEYKGLEGYDIQGEVSDDEIKEEVQNQLEENAKYEDIKDRGAKKSDYITIDYTATVDGKEVKDCKESDCEIQLGNGDFNNKIEKKLIGSKVGSEITVDMKMPEDLSSENAGKDATFTVKVKKLQKEIIPEYNEEYVKNNTDYDNIKDYEASVKEQLLNEKNSDNYTNAIQDLIDKAKEVSTFKEDYPEDLYKVCEKDFNDTIESYAQMFGIESDEYLKDMCGYTDDDIKNEIMTSVKERLLIYAIAEKESLFPDEKEYKEYIESVANEYGYESPEQLEKEYDKDTIIYAAVYDNVGALLYENAKLSKISQDKYEKIQASEEAEQADADDDASSADAEDTTSAETTQESSENNTDSSADNEVELKEN